MRTRQTVLGLIAAAGLASLTSAAQQNATAVDDGKREYTVSGCLLRSGYAGYQIEDAKLDAIDGKPQAESADKSSADPKVPRKWILDGGGNLGARTGEKVQVVGRSDWQPPSAPSAQSDEPPNRTPHLDVKSVKTIAASCS